MQQRFSYLLDSDVYQVASLLDPNIKLSFADHESSTNKFFVFSSIELKAKVRSLLPEQTSDTVLPSPPQSKKPKLLDFSSAKTFTASKSTDSTTAELQTYVDQPLVDINPIVFWSERKTTLLSLLALQLLSVPLSSAPVERLFSKAGYILNQRHTRLTSAKLEQLLFLK